MKLMNTLGEVIFDPGDENRPLDAGRTIEIAVELKQDLSGLKLYSKRINEVNLAGARLKGADLKTCSFFGTDLSGADLRGADLEMALMAGANLKGANLTGANLRYAVLKGAHVEGAKFENADVTGCDRQDELCSEAVETTYIMVRKKKKAAN